MGTLIDLSGKTFNFLTVLTRAPKLRPGESGWFCRCICGNVLRVQAARLKADRIKSCGCKRGELVSAANATHGHWVGGKASRELSSWRSAISRCHNETSTSYPRYGGRGIYVFASWRESFEVFLRDVGPRPIGSTLDRIDPAGNYEPGNCCWSTPKEQSNNMRNNRFVLVHQERLTIRNAADKYALEYVTFRNALNTHNRFVSEAGDLFTMLQR